MIEGYVVGLLIFGLPLLIHSCFIGTLYIKMEYSAGRSRYYVWRRAFMGYNDLIGSFDTEKEAKAAIERVKANPPRVVR